LAIHRLEKDEIEFPGSDEFREVDEVGEEEALENLADNLMGPDKQDHLPLCPVADLNDMTENNLDKDKLTDEPERFNDHPEKKVQLEVHLPDEGVPEHHEIDGIVFL
jgi:hypothetical protein